MNIISNIYILFYLNVWWLFILTKVFPLLRSHKSTLAVIGLFQTYKVVKLHISTIHHLIIVIEIKYFTSKKSTTICYWIWHNSTFFKLYFIAFYKLNAQMCVLVKFQLRILKAFEVTALQSSSNRKIERLIYVYSKCSENKLQALSITDVT